MSNHALPCHSSIRVALTPVLRGYVPTATQSFATEHDTPDRLPLPNAELALGTTCHEVPLHISASVADPCVPRYEPTAAQALCAAQVIAYSLLSDDATLGLETTVHDFPFQRSTRVRPVCCDGSCSPTAKQSDTVGHDTPLSQFPAPAGSGLWMNAHLRPFHRSTSVCWTPEAEIESPTAAQFAGSTHDTPASDAPCPGVGLAASDHEAPSQSATRVVRARRLTRRCHRPPRRSRRSRRTRRPESRSPTERGSAQPTTQRHPSVPRAGDRSRVRRRHRRQSTMWR